MGVLSRLKRRVSGSARLVKDAVQTITARAPAAEPPPSAAVRVAAPPTPVDATDRAGERLWYLDGQQADAGWEHTDQDGDTTGTP